MDSADYILVQEENMKSSDQKIDRKKHLQRYAKSVFSEKLRQRGFVSYKNEDLSWYKVVNGEILMTVYIFTAWPIIPIIPYIGFGIHPLFVEAPIPQKVSIRGISNDEVMTTVTLGSPVKVFDENTLVQCPISKGHGAEKLENEIFPIFDSIGSIEDIYRFYKNRYFSYKQYWNERGMEYDINVSGAFIDMAIYLGDTQMYPLCQRKIELMNQRDLSSYWTKRDMERNQLRYYAIADGQRTMYLEKLEKRKEMNLRTIERKLGIRIMG